MKRSASLAFALAALASCGDEKKPAPAEKPPVHEHQAPHKGALVELGDEAAHVELTFDSATGKVTAYVLDGEAENPVRIVQDALHLSLRAPAAIELDLSAVANPLTGEKVGDTSQFEGTSEMLVGATSFAGALKTITARGVKFDDAPVAYPGDDAKEKR